LDGYGNFWMRLIASTKRSILPVVLQSESDAPNSRRPKNLVAENTPPLQPPLPATWVSVRMSVPAVRFSLAA
jgi:hypothetical protein